MSAPWRRVRRPDEGRRPGSIVVFGAFTGLVGFLGGCGRGAGGQVPSQGGDWTAYGRTALGDRHSVRRERWGCGMKTGLHQPHRCRLGRQCVAELRCRQPDQGAGTLGRAEALKVGDAIFGDDDMDVVARRGHRAAQRRHDA